MYLKGQCPITHGGRVVTARHSSVGRGGGVHIHGVVGGERAILSGSFSSSYINVGLREARARPQNLLGDKPLLTAVKRHPRWFPHCAHSAMVHAYLHKRKMK